MESARPQSIKPAMRRAVIACLIATTTLVYGPPVAAQWSPPIGGQLRRLPPVTSTTNNIPTDASSRLPETIFEATRIGATPVWSGYTRASGGTAWSANAQGSFPVAGEPLQPRFSIAMDSVKPPMSLSTFGGIVPHEKLSSGASVTWPGPALFFARDQEDESLREDSDRQGENTSNDSDDTTQDRDVNRSATDTEPLGEQPEDTSRSFLRSTTVLLEPGHIQVDFGLEYVHFESSNLIGVTGDVALERSRRRQWFVPFSVRYGLDKQTQLFMNIPVGASLLETTTPGGGDTTSVFGMGDVQAGYLRLLREQDDCGPDVIFGASFSAPTGADPFHPGRVAYLGSGFWNVETNLNLIKSIDPAVIFAGIGYVHFFQADYLGQEIRLGERFTYDFGAGFAINDTLTFSTILQGSFQFPTELDGIPLPSSSLEPIGLRMALTYYVCESKIIEPYTRFGLTEDAPQAELGVITTYSY